MPPSRGLARYRANGNYRAVSSQWSGCWPNTPAPSAPHRPGTNSTYYPPAASDQRTHGLQQSTTMTFQSVTFGTDQRTVHDNDATTLNRGVQNPNAMSDSQKANVHIATRSGELHTFNSGTGVETVSPKVTSVQLKAPTGLVKVPGMDAEVTPAVLEQMRSTSPELFLEPEAKAEKAAAAKEEATDRAKEAADLADLNKFADPAVEGVHMHITNDIEFGDQVRLLHELHTTGTVSTGTINRFADQMHMSVADTIDAVNALHMNTSMQLASLCKVAGVDAQAFSTYMKTYQSADMFKAIQVHSQERDMQRAWNGHIAAFKARGGK
jgi:hypothetical protein